VYANRRRLDTKTAKALMRRRGELIERSFAHLYDTGGMRRVHLRGKNNIAKRALIHAAAFNLSLILRQMLRVGTARQAADLFAALCFAFCEAHTSCKDGPPFGRTALADDSDCSRENSVSVAAASNRDFIHGLLEPIAGTFPRTPSGASIWVAMRGPGGPPHQAGVSAQG